MNNIDIGVTNLFAIPKIGYATRLYARIEPHQSSCLETSKSSICRKHTQIHISREWQAAFRFISYTTTISTISMHVFHPHQVVIRTFNWSISARFYRSLCGVFRMKIRSSKLNATRHTRARPKFLCDIRSDLNG